jgi:photosystem II stability/assembly factor-like uncharacterized protein
LLSTSLIASVALLGACSSNTSSPTVVSDSVTDIAENSQVVQAPDWGHVHHLSLSGDTLYIGSHDGLWKQEVDKEPVVLSQPTFDVMGLAGSKVRWLASGHPGPAMDAPSDLGLIESVDGGVTWQSVSLLGEVDFHRLVSQEELVFGVTAHDGSLLRSIDGGRNWSDLGTPLIFDLAINPTNPDILFATSESGSLLSADGGETFTPIITPVQLLLVAWGDQGLYAASSDGEILLSTDNGVNWIVRGSLGGAPVALATDAGNVAGVVDDSILVSTDAGMTFAKRIAGSGKH